MYSVTIYKLLFSSTITPSSWTRLSCRSFLQQTRTTQTRHAFVCNVTSRTSRLRHDRSLCDKGLRCGVVLDALHSNLCPPVIPSHDIWNHNQQWPYYHICHWEKEHSLSKKITKVKLLTSELSFSNNLLKLKVLHVHWPATCCPHYYHVYGYYYTRGCWTQTYFLKTHPEQPRSPPPALALLV